MSLERGLAHLDAVLLAQATTEGHYRAGDGDAVFELDVDEAFIRTRVVAEVDARAGAVGSTPTTKRWWMFSVTKGMNGASTRANVVKTSCSVW